MEDNIVEIFGKQLDQLMLDKNVSDSKLAEDLNMNRSTINRWRRGVRSPNMDTLPLLAKYFNVPTTTFITPLNDKKDILIAIEKLDEKNLSDLKRYVHFLLTNQNN